MIIEVIYHNYKINDKDVLKIEYPNIDYNTWKRTKEYKNDYDLCKILDGFLKDIDCTREYGGCRLCMTTYPVYKTIISKYYYYLIKINNQFIYNKYLDKLINLHNYNIVYEYTNPVGVKTKPNKVKKQPPNKYYKYITHDMFTGEEIYLYINPKTNHEVKSNNPNLLEELNNPKKVKRNKVSSIPLNAMTFSFKKD